MANYPLMFTFRDAVSGNGFLAGITLSGRALMVEEEDGSWWMYGVRPAGIAEAGATPQEAYFRFRNRYKSVLFDIAEETRDFEAFRKLVEGFYSEPDHDEEKRWEDAFRALRSGIVVPERPFSDLPRESPESRPSQIAITRLDEIRRFQASDNVSDTFVMAAAA